MIDLIKRDGTPYRIEPTALSKLITDYPHIDVEGEIRKAANWLEANPRRRKKDVWRYVITWLNRAKPVTHSVTYETSQIPAVVAQRMADSKPKVEPRYASAEVAAGHLETARRALGMRQA